MERPPWSGLRGAHPAWSGPRGAPKAPQTLRLGSAAARPCRFRKSFRRHLWKCHENHQISSVRHISLKKELRPPPWSNPRENPTTPPHLRNIPLWSGPRGIPLMERRAWSTPLWSSTRGACYDTTYGPRSWLALAALWSSCRQATRRSRRGRCCTFEMQP